MFCVLEIGQKLGVSETFILFNFSQMAFHLYYDKGQHKKQDLHPDYINMITLQAWCIRWSNPEPM